VGVIGTGSSGVQLVTATAPEGARLTVFQRTPNFVVPRANAPITDAEDAAVKARYPERRERLRWTPRGLNFTPNKESALEVTPEEREEQYEDAWDNGLGFGFTLTYPDILLDELANDTAADFIRGKISQKVDDPETLESLTPRDYPFGAKRPPVDSDYFDTFNRDNVELVDIRENPIEEITPTGVSTSAGEHELDVIVFATGFDASTNGRLRDVGRIDEDDYITLAGREKESARCGGEQVLPKETEDVLTAHPAVAQAHVVPVPDDRMGEVGVAWIGLHEGASADPDELIAVCAERLARFKVPRHLLFTTANELPTTASGRPRKFLLAERAAKELGAAPAQ
jgi:acyl-CoA synthetase (AMP-forming)/AMP-acid ligase II